MVQREGFPAGEKCRPFYNVMSGTRTATKKAIINKCLILSCVKIFFPSITNVLTFQPNSVACILRCLFSKFKVSIFAYLSFYINISLTFLFTQDSSIVHSLCLGFNAQGSLNSVLSAKMEAFHNHLCTFGRHQNQSVIIEEIND